MRRGFQIFLVGLVIIDALQQSHAQVRSADPIVRAHLGPFFLKSSEEFSKAVWRSSHDALVHPYLGNTELLGLHTSPECISAADRGRPGVVTMGHISMGAT
jgi:hypothetical protein